MNEKQIAEKYVYGKHNALTDSQEIKDMSKDILEFAKDSNKKYSASTTREFYFLICTVVLTSLLLLKVLTSLLIKDEPKTYYPVAIDYNNSTLLRIQTKPELKYFIKEVEVSEKRFYGLLNSIDVSSE